MAAEREVLGDWEQLGCECLSERNVGGQPKNQLFRNVLENCF